MINIPKVAGLIGRLPASEAELSSLESRSGGQLPPDYKDLLRQTNGFSVSGGLALYGCDEIEERNETWEVAKYCPGYVAVGDTGGGEVILLRKSDQSVHIVGTGSMMPEDMREIGKTLNDWFAKSLPTPPI
jgi:SMI1 / KNR4 family (SUKH-1)